MLAKAVHLALAPFAVSLWLAVVVLDRVPRRRAVIALVVLALGILAPTLSQFAEDLARYGNLTPMVEAIINHRAGRTGADLLRTAVGVNWPRAVISLWVRKGLMVGGWSFLLPPRWLVDCYTLLVGLGLSGWAWSALGAGGRVFRSALTSAACAALAASYTAALAYHAIHSTAASASPQQTPGTPPRRCPGSWPWWPAVHSVGRSGRCDSPGRHDGPGVHRRRGHGHLGRDDHDLRRRPWRLGGPGTAHRVLQPAGLGTATLFAAALGAPCC